MKVYVLTVGSYSDYQILGVFTSREKALEFCPALESGLRDDARPSLEEWESDPQREEKFLQETFRVYLNISDGSIYLESHTAEDKLRDHSESFVSQKWCCGESVISRDHAFKLAVEARQQYLREKELTSK